MLSSPAIASAAQAAAFVPMIPPLPVAMAGQTQAQLQSELEEKDRIIKRLMQAQMPLASVEPAAPAQPTLSAGASASVSELLSHQLSGLWPSEGGSSCKCLRNGSIALQ